MWTLVRSHLVAKIAIVLVATLALGFGLPAFLNARLQSDELERRSQQSAGDIARSLAAGVRTAMLTGNGITARKMVEDARSRITAAEIRIYAPSGEEVFGVHPPPPEPSTLPEHVRLVLQEGEGGAAPDGARAVAVANEERCRNCHPEGDLRGVLTIGTQGASLLFDDRDQVAQALSRITQSAFEQVMTAEKEGNLDGYFEELAAATAGLAGVAIVDPDGDKSFGAELPLDAAAIGRALEGAGAQSWENDERDLRLFVRALPNEPQCHACHDAESTVRGAIVLAQPRGEIDPEETLLRVADVSLRHVMLAGLGRLIARFLDTMAETGAVTTLTLHDADGRLFRDAFAEPIPPPMVAAALVDQGTRFETTTDEVGQRFTFVEPLRNEEECRQCHGADHELRGAIEVVLDTTDAVRSQRRLLQTGMAFGLGTIVLTMFVLYLGLRALVVRPVAEIGDVAEQVGGGRLDARVSVRSNDEIGRLGERLNQMILEIRKKIELSKFVSQATVHSVDAAASGVERQGQRSRVTVLFSDIRGFTSFSETVEPEAVVEVLNRYLDAQSEVVEKWSGDIDKFVGDELMAIFRGESMESRAVACAVEMLEAVAAINETLPEGVSRLQVGIGINVGEVVLGAMGAKARMDFTVIGDAVNLGARLCSAAAPGQVIVSEAVREAVSDVSGVAFGPLPPIMVKGKKDPIVVHEARRG